MNRNQLLKKFVRYVRLTWDRQLTESIGGNMSIRIHDEVYITPTMFIKHFLTVHDLIKVNLSGHQLSGKLKASSEIKMHLKLYQDRQDIQSIFHAHPRNALICSINQMKILTQITPESAILMGKIAYLPYIQPGTNQFAQSFVSDENTGSHIFILENHGVTTCGDTIEIAYARLEALETCAYLTVMQKLFNHPPHLIAEEEIRKMIN